MIVLCLVACLFPTCFPSAVLDELSVKFQNAKMLLNISNEVINALGANKPVVALESTVIAHGLPRPINLEVAQRLENNLRQAGVTPATIGIINGELTVGLNVEQIRLLAEEPNVKKITTRDLPIALARGWTGATTVASTSWIAHRAGINVFATGGIGGVHRGTLADISADLPELARTPIIVVCSGAKIVLDLPATREWLETHGVTVVGYQCDEMPAFYTRTSGLPVDTRADSAAEVTKLFQAQRNLRMEVALLVTVPVPAVFEVDGQKLSHVLDEALAQAEHEEIAGRDVTPFLLSRMAQCSEGATLRANIALLENNTRVAAEIAKSLSDMFDML
jgi:pseudouridine-5'-phosphate glycosidase